MGKDIRIFVEAKIESDNWQFLDSIWNKYSQKPYLIVRNQFLSAAFGEFNDKISDQIIPISDFSRGFPDDISEELSYVITNSFPNGNLVESWLSLDELINYNLNQSIIYSTFTSIAEKKNFELHGEKPRFFANDGDGLVAISFKTTLEENCANYWKNEFKYLFDVFSHIENRVRIVYLIDY